MSSLAFEAAGTLGVILYLSAYGALQLGLLRGSGYAYAFLNLAAASMMLVSLMQSFNPFSAVIETCWIALSLIGIVRIFVLRNGLRFSPEEREFLQTKFPGLEPILARRLISAGRWRDAAPGEVLTKEGEAVPALVWIRSGRASVCVQGREVGECRDGSLVGEFGAVGGHPAIATVSVVEPSRVFEVPTPALATLMKRGPGIRIGLDAAIGAEARAKIMAANARTTAMA